MTDLMPTIENILDLSDFPRRRETFEAPTAQRVLVWRILSRDEDINEDHQGVLISETTHLFNVQLDGDGFVTSFPKVTPSGVTVYRMQRITS
jgi:hypothetical protein